MARALLAWAQPVVSAHLARAVAAAGPAAAAAATAAPSRRARRSRQPAGHLGRRRGGRGAQGWDSCDQKPDCQTKVGGAGRGMNGSTALKFHGEGPGWLGMGWNLFGWYPENAGIDLSPYSHLTFQIRVEGEVRRARPWTGSPGVLLGCSGNKKDSADVPIEKYAKGFGDGKWHKIEIPISAFTKGPGAQFDLHSFWEFRLTPGPGRHEFRYLHRRYRRREAVARLSHVTPSTSRAVQRPAAEGSGGLAIPGRCRGSAVAWHASIANTPMHRISRIASARCGDLRGDTAGAVFRRRGHPVRRHGRSRAVPVEERRHQGWRLRQRHHHEPRASGARLRTD